MAIDFDALMAQPAEPSDSYKKEKDLPMFLADNSSDSFGEGSLEDRSYSKRQLDDAIKQASKPGELDVLLNEQKNRTFTKSPETTPIDFDALQGGTSPQDNTTPIDFDALIKPPQIPGNGFIPQAQNTLKDLSQAAGENPASIPAGLVEAGIGGVGAMGEAAVSGLYGLGKGMLGDQPFGQGFTSGMEEAQNFMSPVTKELQPQTEFGKAALNTLGLLPAAAHVPAEAVFETMQDSGNETIRSLAPAFGAATEAGLNLFMMKGMLPKTKGKAIEAIPKEELVKVLDDTTNNLQSRIDDLVSSRTKAGTNLEDTIANPDAKMADAYDAIAANKQVRPDQKLVAEAMLRLNDTLGTNNVDLIESPGIAPREGTHGGQYVEKYDDANDGVFHYGLSGKTPEQQAYILLHEGVHSASKKAIEIWETEKDNPNLSPAKKAIVDKVEVLNKVFEHAKANSETLKTHPMDSNLTEMENLERTQHLYGFADLHEFVSESWTSKEFQKTLSDIKIKPEDKLTLELTDNLKAKSRITNVWEAFKKSIKSIISGGNESTALDLALEHSINLFESIESKRVGNRSERIAEAKSKEGSNALSDFFMQRISDLLNVSGSDKSMFETRLRAEPGGPGWQDFVTRNRDTLWENGRRINEVVGENTKYREQAKSDQMFQHDPRSVDTFIDQEIPKGVDLVEADDLKPAGTNAFSANITNISKAGTLAGKIKKFFTDKAQEYKVLQAVVFHSAMEQFSEFNKLSIKDKKGVMDAAIHIDNRLYREKLVADKLQWPTTEMLKADFPHLSDAQVSAYGKITQGLDFLHSLLNQTRKMAGKEPLEQIPGYMPHVFDGAYKVFMTITEGKNTRVTAVKGFKTSYGAMDMVRKIQSGMYDKPGMKFGVDSDRSTKLPYKVQKHGDLTSGMTTILQEHMNAYYNQLELSPEAKTVFDRIEKDSMQGFNKHELERSDISGYIGSFGVQEPGGINALKERLGILSGENKKILSLYENYARSVTDHYKNLLFVNEVASRFLTSGMNGEKPNYGQLFAELPKLNKHLTEYTYNFTGENINKLGFVDDALRNLSVKVGIDPNMYRRFARDMRNWLSLTKLRVNPANYIGNYLQPAQMLSLLQYVNAARSNEGLKSPNVMATFAKVTKDRLNPDDYQKAAIQWAKEQHILDPQLEPEMRGANPSKLTTAIHTATGGDINPKIEGIGRTTSYLMALEHFRQIYPEDPMAARRAAANLMEMGMVNYDRSSRPLMYQNFGVVGEAISPFAVFRNAYIGNTYLMLKLAAQSPKNLSNFLPLIMMQTTYLLTAGAFGIVGAAEYDLLVNELNKLFPSLELPTLAETLFKAKVPDALTYGVIANTTKYIPGLSEGVNLSSSMNAVGADDVFQAAMVPFITALGTGVGIAGREILHKMMPDTIDPVGSSTMYKAAKQVVPGIFHKYLEDQFKTNSNVGIDVHGVGDTTRTKAGDLSLMLTGKKSITETKEATENYTIKQSAMQVQTELKNLAELGADYAENIRKDIDINQINKRAAQLGATADEFSKSVVDAINKRRTTTRFREAESSTNKATRSQRERDEMGN